MAPRILHIGVGNFHRAHQADYTARATGEWRVTGVVMGNIALYDAMKNGEGFPLVVRGPNGADQRQVSIHDRMILARDNRERVLSGSGDWNVGCNQPSDRIRSFKTTFQRDWVFGSWFGRT